MGKNIVSAYLVRGPQTHVIERTALDIVRGLDVTIALSRGESFIRIQYLIERAALIIVRGLDVKIALSRDESFIRIQWNQISPLPS